MLALHIQDDGHAFSLRLRNSARISATAWESARLTGKDEAASMLVISTIAEKTPNRVIPLRTVVD